MTLLDAALQILERRVPEILTLTEAWVRENSHSKNVAGVERVADAICTALSPLPLTLERVKGEPWGSHLHLSTASASARNAPTILLIGHHDTVFPQGTFEGFRSDSVHAYGPGVLDMKGGLAIVAVVLRCLHELGVLSELPLSFVSVADEEVGSPTSRVLLEELAPRAACALVFESGRAGDAIVTARRGSGFARVTSLGRAAHAGNRLNDGRNAIWALSRFVDRVQQANAELQGASISTGLFKGGSARNTVAEQAEAEIDLRFEDEVGQASVERVLTEAAREVQEELPGIALSSAVRITRRPLVRSLGSVALCDEFGGFQRAAGLGASEAPRQGGGSDANTVGALGVPVIDGLGPRGTGYHTHQEQIEIASLRPKAEALLRFLLARLRHNVAE